MRYVLSLHFTLEKTETGADFVTLNMIWPAKGKIKILSRSGVNVRDSLEHHYVLAMTPANNHRDLTMLQACCKFLYN